MTTDIWDTIVMQQPAEGIASSTESVAEGLSAREQERVKEDDSTPTKQPTVAAAIVSAAAAAHAAPVTFYGSHRVFLAPHPAGETESSLGQDLKKSHQHLSLGE